MSQTMRFVSHDPEATNDFLVTETDTQETWSVWPTSTCA